MKSPLTFTEIKNLINKKEFSRFYRSEEIEKRYQTEKQKALLSLKKELEFYQKVRHRWVLRPNDYPYHFEKDLEHWVLWDVSLEGDWTKTAIDFPNYKKKKLPKKQGWILNWINPPQLRSVGNIPHIHLIKLKENK